MTFVPRPGKAPSPPPPGHRLPGMGLEDDLVVVGRLTDSRPWAEDGSAVATVHDLELPGPGPHRRSDDHRGHGRDAHLPPHRVPERSRRPSPGWSASTWPAATPARSRSRFGGPRGCTHLEHLARSLGPVVIQAVTSRRAAVRQPGRVRGPAGRGRGHRQPVGA